MDTHWTELRKTWPLRRTDVGAFVGWYVGLTVLWAVIGELVQRSGWLVEADQDLAEEMAEGRTEGVDGLSLAGSLLSETAVKVIVTSLVGIVLLYLLRRWRDTVVIWVSLILEACVFLTVTLIVKRPRPDVPRLDGSPVDSSFPSGHVAAAACYGAMTVVLFWHTRRTWIRAVAVVFTIAVPLAVAWARMYRGMHHLSDVIAGVIIGVMCVIITVRIVNRAEQRRLDDRTERPPAEHAETDDATFVATGRDL